MAWGPGLCRHWPQGGRVLRGVIPGGEWTSPEGSRVGGGVDLESSDRGKNGEIPWCEILPLYTPYTLYITQYRITNQPLQPKQVQSDSWLPLKTFKHNHCTISYTYKVFLCKQKIISEPTKLLQTIFLTSLLTSAFTPNTVHWKCDFLRYCLNQEGLWET